jgi:multidrug transporter EmrE-like cation transporter
MCASLLGGGPHGLQTVCGLMTSGGTESILSAVKVLCVCVCVCVCVCCMALSQLRFSIAYPIGLRLPLALHLSGISRLHEGICWEDFT